MNAITRNSRILLAAVLLFSAEYGLGGGGIHLEFANPTLANLTIYDNSAENGGG